MARATKETHVGMDMYAVEVDRVADLSPHLRRITLTAPELVRFRDDGPDQRFKLLLPRDHQRAPILPNGDSGWYDEWLAMDAAERPVMRTYTIRAARPEQAEVDVDVVLHGDGGPASRWASRARRGDRVGVYGAWAEYDPPAGARQLIIGDHTALPAVAAICEQLGPDARATVVIEVAGAADELELDRPPGVDPVWVHGDPDRPGSTLVEAVTGLDEEIFDYAWVAGEQSVVAELRRHLIHRRGMRPEQIMFMGYWRIGAAIDES